MKGGIRSRKNGKFKLSNRKNGQAIKFDSREPNKVWICLASWDVITRTEEANLGEPQVLTLRNMNIEDLIQKLHLMRDKEREQDA